MLPTNAPCGHVAQLGESARLLTGRLRVQSPSWPPHFQVLIYTIRKTRDLLGYRTSLGWSGKQLRRIKKVIKLAHVISQANGFGCYSGLFVYVMPAFTAGMRFLICLL